MELIVKTSMLSFHSQSNVERFSSDLWNLSSSWRNWYCLGRASIVGCRNCPFHQPMGKDSSHGTLQSICRNWTSTSHNFHSPEYSGKRNRDIFDSRKKLFSLDSYRIRKVFSWKCRVQRNDSKSLISRNFLPVDDQEFNAAVITRYLSVCICSSF